MASKKSTNTKTAGQTTVISKGEARRRRHADVQQMQNVLLIWLDSRIIESNDDCQNTITQLRCAVNDVNIYTNGELCVQFIETIRENKVCKVISGALGQRIVPRVHDMSQVDSIFIFCGDKKRHEGWAKDWPKIKDVFTEITPICEALKQAAQQCEHNATPMSFVATDKKSDQLDPSFMYTQILKEILLTIDCDEEDIQEYADYCRNAFAKNNGELKNIEQLERHYHD